MEDFFEEDKRQVAVNSFDIKQYFFKLLNNYIWIILCLVLSLIAGKLYLRYTVPQYQVSSYILIGGGDLESGTNTILTNAGVTNSIVDNTGSMINNEIFILKSHIIIGQVVDSLKLYQNFIKLGTIRQQPVFQQDLPVTVNVKRKFTEQPTPVYKLVLNNTAFAFEHENGSFKGHYGKSFIFNQDTILIVKNPKTHIKRDQEYGFQLSGRLSTIKRYISRLTVAQTKNGGQGLLQLSMTDEIPLRASKFIEVLIRKYNLSSQNYKNAAIHSALAFLGKRLTTVSDELEEQENLVRDFKAENKIYDVSATATELLTSLKDIDVQKTQNIFQEQLLQLVESTIRNYSVKEEIVATTSSLEDPVLMAQIIKYNEMVVTKQAVLSTGTLSDPRLGPINDQLADLRKNIQTNINNLRRQFKKTDSYYSGQENRFSGKFEALPEKEKRFVELTRKLEIKQTLYLFLLQKNEETEIQLVSSDAVKSRTVDDILNDGIVSPISTMVYSTAAAAGLFLPAFIILLRVLLSRKIETKKEIKNATDVPILGELSFSPSENPIAITATNRTVIAEQLRTIRTNLSYIGGTTSKKVFIVASSMSGEGKSFVSLNLGNSMAISNKKVAVLELDLRKPMLSKKLGINNKKGISNYLVSENMLPEEIIQQVENYPNLFLLNSGPVPPNPGELIINPRLGILIAYLRENFDYVILDSPPVGLVADALSLAKLADISLFIIRPNYSFKSSLTLVNELYALKKLPNLSLIINGIESNKGYGEEGYGYGYNYGYYSDNEHAPNNFKNTINKIFKRS